MTEFSSSELLPQQEKGLSLPQWNSAYQPVALTTLAEVIRKKIRSTRPEATDEDILREAKPKQEKLGRYLGAIDKEAVRNFGVFESEGGVRFPYTKVSVNAVAGSVQNIPVNQETEKSEKKTVVLFTPFTPPPGGGPDDIMNIIYDRVLSVLPETADRKDFPAKNITVYALGLPTSQWGSVSDEWLSNFKENGFSEYGKLYAEFLRTVIGKGNILFFAGSMGTILASETARQLPEVWENLRLLLNNPTGVHNPTRLPVKGLQVSAGFVAEAGIRVFADRIVKTAMSGAKPTREALSAILQQKGIIAYISDEQNRLKKSAYWKTIRLLIKGTPLDTENFRSYIEQGMLDPATTNPKRALSLMGDKKKWFKAGKRSLGMGINYTHWMDPGRRPDKWVKIIEQYEKSINAQAKPAI